MTKKEKAVYELLLVPRREWGLEARELAQSLGMQRSNVSALLNQLMRVGLVEKGEGRPVLYRALPSGEALSAPAQPVRRDCFETLLNHSKSLKKPIEQVRAAMHYPPNGLNSLLIGPTGVGKSFLAERMFRYGVEIGRLREDAPFVVFNCADYANNPQLLLSHLFGHKKGAFTGAEESQLGLVAQADRGILFLDEIHRLPPEGQEMLFYLIDHGEYKPLGHTGDVKTAQVQIIAATTEVPESALLSTFLRRIPMVINIPSLAERGFDERLELTISFFRNESARLGRELQVEGDVMRSLVLYDCPGNIGQLQNDIRIGCANAFVRSITQGLEQVRISLPNLPDYAQRGILKYKLNRAALEAVLPESAAFTFSKRGTDIAAVGIRQDDDFYHGMERRARELKEMGIEAKEIDAVMGLDIQNYFRGYLKVSETIIDKESMASIVDKRIIYYVEDFFQLATQKLNRVFQNKYFYGLCLHISASIERIRANKLIQNPQLVEIIENYPEEYAVSMYLVEQLEKAYDIKIPVDETAFIAMFISRDFTLENERTAHPVVLIAMHGNSTAKSMADVVNALVGGNNAYSYDMPLTKSVEAAYDEIKERVQSIDQGCGVIMVVDMGSLRIVGEMISNEISVKIRTLEYATTITAVEAARRASMETDIDLAYSNLLKSVNHLLLCGADPARPAPNDKQNIIITMCMTGEGSAVKLKNMVEEHLHLEGRDINVVPLAIFDKNDMLDKVNRLKERKNIIAIVSTFNPELYNIPYISMSELLFDKNYDKLRILIRELDQYPLMNQPLKEATGEENREEFYAFVASQIDVFSVDEYRIATDRFERELSSALGVEIAEELYFSLFLHLACVIEMLINGTPTMEYRQADELKAKYSREFKVIRQALRYYEEPFHISFPQDAVCYLIKILLHV